MTVARGPNNKSIPLNIVGSSKYSLYKKMNSEITINSTISDNWLVPYPGYKMAIPASAFNNAKEGRALYESVKLNSIIGVFGNGVYIISLFYDHTRRKVLSYNASLIGKLETSTGVVYISENNKPQILISDGSHFYLYDPLLSIGTFNFSTNFTAPPGTEPQDSTFIFSQPLNFEVGEPITLNTTGTLPAPFMVGTTYYIFSSEIVGGVTNVQLVANISDIPLGTPLSFTDNGTGVGSLITPSSNFITVSTDFTPGYITFHDTYFIAAASNDTFYQPPANNTWRLSAQNNGLVWVDTAQTIGLLETKPDNTKAVVRFPSKGNMILVMGETVTEYWYDVGAQLFPYQRQNQASIDYGCLNPATVAFMDEIVVWLARNEKSGPVIMYTTGGMPEKVTTDGIDYQFSELQNPESSQGFLYRKNGHLFYHINFYADNISFVVDFTSKKIFNACDQDLNYYIMGQVVWFQNQYFSITKNNGNLFIFDTVITTYDNFLPDGFLDTTEIPRIRICEHIRLPSQDYFVATDCGFTIETGETDYYLQISETPPLLPFNLVFVNGDDWLLVSGDQFVTVDLDPLSSVTTYIQTLPRIDLSVSYDGGSAFGADMPYVLNPIGKRRNRLMWWQLGAANDLTIQIKAWGIGRFIATDGVVNIRT